MTQKNYFKGIYFKCEDSEKTVALIPAVHQNSGRLTSSLQIITDDAAHQINLDSGAELFNSCRFSMNGIKLDIKDRHTDARGVLRFGPKTPLAYDIMGPFKYVPFMQCRHTVYSMHHRVDGTLTVNGKDYTFNGGSGYIEGDRGYSFPREYLWTHCHTPFCSLMLSVADIPFGFFSFTGVIGAVVTGGKEYRIATYLGAHAVRISDGCATVKQGDYALTARLIKKNAHPLLAPRAGVMSRTIHESASCTAEYIFCRQGEKILHFISDRAGFEYEY